MSWQVVISYARGASREHAEALHRALGADVAFLDTTSIEHGRSFPHALADALLGSRIVVVFVDDAYFTRWYCLWELRTALAPFLALPPGASEEEKALALAPLVLALPPGEGTATAMARLPPRLRNLQWPRADQTEQLTQWIRACLAGEQRSLGTRLEGVGRLEETRARLLQESVLPPARLLSGLPLYPRELPPSIGSSFVGREDDLWRIDFALTTASAGEGPAAALSGALEAGGGFGKTRLALEYLHRLGPRHFPGGLFWVDADVREEQLEAQHHGILRTLRPDVPPLPEFRQQQREAASELAQALHERSAKEPILYVVDNVPEPAPDQRPKPLRTWCPALGKVALLVTSRTRLSLGTERIQAIAVPTLAPDAAVALLTEQVERSSLQASDWQLIAEWVGHLPLALELLNRAMQASALTPAELLERARRIGPVLELDRQMEALRAHIPEGQLRGVTEALSLSYERLPTEAQRAARLLAHLSPAPIPVALLDALKELFPPQVRTWLTLRSFVTGATRTGVPLFGSMHRVLADFLRGRSPEPSLEMGEMGTVLTEFLASERSEDHQSWPLLDACAPHAQWHFESSIAYPNPELRAQLGLRLGHLRALQGLVRQALELRRAAAEWAGKTLGAEHPATLAAKSDLGDSLRQHGDLQESLELLTETLALHRRVYGEERPETLSVMNNLALALADLDDPGARAMMEHVVEVRQRALGEDHASTASAMSNLATILFDSGDLKGSLALHERALAIRRRVLGEEHQETLFSKGTVASTLRKLGDHAAARAIQEPLLETYQRILGRGHPDTLVTMLNLGVTQFALSDFEAARRLQEETTALFSRTLGEDHPLTLTSKANLAETLWELGELAEANTLSEQTLHARRQKLGELHSDTISSWRNLFHAFEQRGDLRGARDVQQRLLRILEEACGRQAVPTVTHAWWFFCAFDHLDEIATAQGILEQYLFWLLDRAPDSLEPDLRTYREKVARVLAMRATPYRR